MRFRSSSNYLCINIQLSQYHFLIKLSSVQLSLHLCQKIIFPHLYGLTSILLLSDMNLPRFFNYPFSICSTVSFFIPYIHNLCFCFFFPLILLPRNRSILLISFLPLRVYFYSVTQWHKFINNIALLPFSHCRICIWFSHVYNSCFLLLYWLFPWWFELGIDQCY